MAIAITWQRMASITEFDEPVTSGVCNVGGRLVTVIGNTFFNQKKVGAVYYSDNHGLTWIRGSDLALFSRLGISGSVPTDFAGGLLCYAPGHWLHGEDGQASLSGGDGGPMLRAHKGAAVDAGTPVYSLNGYGTIAQPCLDRRKDGAGAKFALWAGAYLYETFGTEPTGPLLLELSQAGATTLTTAFLLHQLDPGGNPYAVPNEDGSISWLWVTQPPTINGVTPETQYASGWFFFLLASYDGLIFRPYSDAQNTLTARGSWNGGSSYNGFTQAFFLRDGTVLCGVNVSGLSPCIFRSTARAVAGSLVEIVLPPPPGLNFINYVPQGGSGSFVFSGLFVMTHCFCELDDGTILCAGGAPSITGISGTQPGTIYHYPAVWRSSDSGVTWQNISLNLGFDVGLPQEPNELWEGRILLSLGGQAALLVCAIDAVTADPNWTPFFITEDGGDSFVKSIPAREGLMTGFGGNMTRPFFWPIQATYANDGSIIVVFTDWSGNVEIWRGTLGTAVQEHRAVGFVEQADIAGASFSNASIPEQELIRG